jgi:hypothetical protein
MLTASGRRVDLTDRNAINAISASRMGWQQHAWDYRDLVPELNSALRFRANAQAKVALSIGQVLPDSDDDEPIAIDSDQCTLPQPVRKAAIDCLNRLPWRNGHSFLGTLDTCYSVAGEAWLHGRNDGGAEVWSVLSSDEVVPVGGSGALGVVSVPGRPARPIDVKSETLIRLWLPHPRFKALSDSPMRSLQDVLEDIILTGRELRAAAKSRIAANGVLFIPQGMSILRPGVDQTEPDDFATEMQAAIIAPIANEGEPGSVVPIMIEGDKEDIAAVKHITFQRETSAGLVDKLRASLTRMGESIDVPPTVVTGLQDTNHWNAYVIDATTFRNHLEPGVRAMVDSITEGYLRPSLMLPETDGGYGLTQDEVNQVVVWYNAGKVTENANRATDAMSAYDRFAIGPKALREATGFNDDDKPSDDELMVMLASKVSVDPATAGVLLSKVFGIPIAPPTTGGTTVVPSAPTVRQISGPAGNAPAAQPRMSPSQSGTPSTSAPLPQTTSPPAAPAGVRTAAASQMTDLRVVSADKLAHLDAVLLERLLVASEAAVQRALEKANAKIRSAAQGKINKLEISQHDLMELGAWLGEDRVHELGLTEDALLAAAFAVLSSQFTQWTTAAIGQALNIVGGMVTIPLGVMNDLNRRMVAAVPAAWNSLQHALHTRALAALFGRGGTQDRGESVPEDIVKAGDIRTALAHIGGMPGGSEAGRTTTGRPLGGIGLGSNVTDLITQHAGPPIGITWVYGPEPRNTFHPHLALDDHRFDSLRDERLAPPPGYDWLGNRMHPGDHEGCRCHTPPAWILPENAGPMDPDLRQEIQAALADESPAMRNIRMLAEMDDQAGRTGTVAQQQRDERDRILRIRDEWLYHVRKAS